MGLGCVRSASQFGRGSARGEHQAGFIWSCTRTIDSQGGQGPRRRRTPSRSLAPSEPSTPIRALYSSLTQLFPLVQYPLNLARLKKQGLRRLPPSRASTRRRGGAGAAKKTTPVRHVGEACFFFRHSRIDSQGSWWAAANTDLASLFCRAGARLCPQGELRRRRTTYAAAPFSPQLRMRLTPYSSSRSTTRSSLRPSVSRRPRRRLTPPSNDLSARLDLFPNHSPRESQHSSTVFRPPHPSTTHRPLLLHLPPLHLASSFLNAPPPPPFKPPAPPSFPSPPP